jgi:hypothetical protein
MLIDEMEALWAPIAEHDDWSAFHTRAGGDRGDAAGLRAGLSGARQHRV